MPLRFSCPKCGKTLVLQKAKRGDTGKCSKCLALITVPAEAEEYGEAVKKKEAPPVRPAEPSAAPIKQPPLRFWRCPHCSQILIKPSHGVTEDFALVTGTASCPACGGASSQTAVYAGTFDVPVVRGTCQHCGAVLEGPEEILLGKQCPACSRTLPTHGFQ